MPTGKYGNLIDSLAIEIALAENEGKSAEVVRAIEKRVFKVQSTIDKIQAKKPAADMEALAAVAKELGGVEKMTAGETQRLALEVERLAKYGATVPPALQKAVDSLNKVREAEKALATESVRTLAMDKAHTDAIIENRARMASRSIALDKAHMDALVENHARMAKAVADQDAKAMAVDRAHVDALAEGRVRASSAAAAAQSNTLLGQIAARGSLASGVAGYAQTQAGAAIGVTAATAAPIAAVGIAASAAASAVGALIAKTIEHAASLKSQAAEAQISAETLQRMQFALRESNAEATAAVPAMVNFNKNLDEGGEKFAKWGLSVEHLKSLKPEEQMNVIAQTMRSLSSESERAGFANDMFGKSGTQMLKAMTGDWEALNAAASDYGAVMSNQDVDQLEALGSAWERLGGTVEALAMQLANVLVKAVGAKDLASAIDLIAKSVGTLAGMVDKHGPKIAQLILALSPAARDINRLVSFGGMLAGAAGSGESFDGVRGGVSSSQLHVQPTLTAEESRGFNDWNTLNDRTNAERNAARAAAATKAAGEAKKWADDELKSVIERIDAYKRFLEAKLKINEAEEDHARLLAAQMSHDANGSVTTSEKDFWKSIDAGRPPAPSDTVGPALSDRQMGWASARAIADTIEKKEKQKRVDLEIAAILEKQGYSQKEINAALSRTLGDSMTWAQLAQTVSNQLSSMGKMGSTIGGLVGGAASIGSIFEKGKGALVGGIGDMFKSVKGLSGGIAAGFAAFDMAKTLYAVLHKTEAQKVAFDVGRDYGVQISEGLAKEIAKTSKTMGRDGASLLNLDKIIGEAGGVSAFGVEKTAGKLRDLFSMIQTGKMTADQARKPFDALFGEVVQASISKTTGLISDQAAELRDLAKASGMKSEAVEKFENEQRDVAMSIIERIAKSDRGFSNAGESEAIGSAVAAQFERLRKSGLSAVEVAEKLGPLIESLQDKFHRAGVGGGAAFEAMLAKVEVFRDELTGPVAQGFEDTIGLAAALFNSGDLTKGQFKGLASAAAASFGELQGRLAEQGKDPAAAFEMMAGDLQKLWEMQRRFNIDLDETSQKMLDDAEAQGVVGVEFMDPLLAEAERTNEILEAGFRGMGASLDGLSPRNRGASEPGSPTAPSVPTIPTIPGDMSSYGNGRGFQEIASAIADSASAADIGAAAGESVAPSLDALAAGMSGLGALASQPILNRTSITLSSGALLAESTQMVERGGPEAMAFITAIAERIKSRG